MEERAHLIKNTSESSHTGSLPPWTLFLQSSTETASLICLNHVAGGENQKIDQQRRLNNVDMYSRMLFSRNRRNSSLLFTDYLKVLRKTNEHRAWANGTISVTTHRNISLELEKVFKTGEYYEVNFEEQLWKAAVLTSFKGNLEFFDIILLEMNFTMGSYSFNCKPVRSNSI